MLYGRMIMATIPHGIVKKIDVSKALSIPGVRAIITCMDDKTIWHSGERLHDRRVFTDRVRFVGDTIGAVAATNRKIAQRAVDSIEVEYEELPAVFTIEEARKEGAPKIWETGNILGTFQNGFGNIDEAFRKGEMSPWREYETSRVHNAPIEPVFSLAWWDGDRLTVGSRNAGNFPYQRRPSN